MSAALRSIPLPWSFSPARLLRAWPRGRYLAALCSSPTAESGGRWARWSFFTSPVRVLTLGPDEPDPIGRLGEEIESTRLPDGASSPSPFAGGWLVALNYELGRSIEPTAAMHPTRSSPDWPWSIVLWRCPWTLAYDHAESRWWQIDRGPSDDWRQRPPDFHNSSPDILAGAHYSLAEPQPTRPRAEYLQAVRRAVEYIHAGDAFQVNLAHHLRASFEGSTRALFADLLAAAGPWYGAYLELAQGDNLHAALSISPELFLAHHGPTRLVTTRPIKGTRPGNAHPDALLRSVKDQAELNMIVDLMRSDLGRVCRTGSVRVAQARQIETHASVHCGPLGRNGQSGPASGIHHGVATIHGTLRTDRTIADLLRATFPGGSITGAPKVRAMQIIEELEPAPRGLYTGAIGYLSDCGNLALNIAIRTALIRGTSADPLRRIDELSGGSLSYGVGAGIVADSDPEQEWQETLDKAGTLLDVAAAQRTSPVITPAIRQGAPA